LEKQIQIHQDLIRECIVGNRDAQFRLYQNYAKAMFNICYRITNNYNDAEDALQEAFVKVFNNISEFEGRSSFGSWCKKIVVNTALNQIKKKKVKIKYVEEMDPEIVEHNESDENIYLNVDRVKKAVQKLPDGFRIVFSLYLLEGYDHMEIAQILNISESTSKSQYNRAKKRLKELLKDEVYYE